MANSKKTILKFCNELAEILSHDVSSKVIEIFSSVFKKVYTYLPEDPEIYRANLLDRMKQEIIYKSDDEIIVYVGEIVREIFIDCLFTINRGSLTEKMENDRQFFETGLVMLNVDDESITIDLIHNSVSEIEDSI